MDLDESEEIICLSDEESPEDVPPNVPTTTDQSDQNKLEEDIGDSN